MSAPYHPELHPCDIGLLAWQDRNGVVHVDRTDAKDPSPAIKRTIEKMRRLADVLGIPHGEDTP